MNDSCVKQQKVLVDKARLLAIVPARGGSKRLPGKNLRKLGDRPLIAWSIGSALESGLFVDVLVSTDDPRIADAAKIAGGLVPWLRPSELAGDTTPSADVLRHALAWYEATHGAVDGVALLQPTSPFRRQHSLHGAVTQFLQQPAECRSTIVSVSPAAVPPQWCFQLKGDELDPLLGWDVLKLRSQDLAPCYQLNGSMYIFQSDTVRSPASLVTPGTRAFVMSSPEESIDIDTTLDWHIAVSFLQEQSNYRK